MKEKEMNDGSGGGVMFVSATHVKALVGAPIPEESVDVRGLNGLPSVHRGDSRRRLGAHEQPLSPARPSDHCTFHEDRDALGQPRRWARPRGVGLAENLVRHLVEDGRDIGPPRPRVKICPAVLPPVEPGALSRQRATGGPEQRIVLDLPEIRLATAVIMQSQLSSPEILASPEDEPHRLGGIPERVEVDQHAKQKGVKLLDLAPESHRAFAIHVRVDDEVLGLVLPASRPVTPQLLDSALRQPLRVEPDLARSESLKVVGRHPPVTRIFDFAAPRLGVVEGRVPASLCYNSRDWAKYRNFSRRVTYNFSSTHET